MKIIVDAPAFSITQANDHLNGRYTSQYLNAKSIIIPLDSIQVECLEIKQIENEIVVLKHGMQEEPEAIYSQFLEP